MNYKENLVSIIMPAYNAEKYISESIDSILSQDYQKWELIIVNDCSTDDTVKLIKKKYLKNKKIILIEQQQNGGPAVARQKALSYAKGQYVAFCDSDDIWLANKLRVQIDFMKIHKVVLSYTAFRRFKIVDNKIVEGHLIQIPRKLTYDQLLSNTAIATSTAVIDRQLTGHISILDCYYDDYALWLSILKQNFVAIGIPQDLMRYRVLPGSVSRNKLRSIKEVWKTYRNIERLGIFKSLYSICGYAKNALLKYRYF